MNERAKKRLRRVLLLLAGIPVLLFILYGCRSICTSAPKPLLVKERAVTALAPLTDETRKKDCIAIIPENMKYLPDHCLFSGTCLLFSRHRPSRP